MFGPGEWHASVSLLTSVILGIEEISKENNLRGIFVKEALKKLELEEYSEEEIIKAIEIGLDAMSN